MSIAYKLPPASNESPRGYIWRLAVENGYQSPTQLLAVLNLPAGKWDAHSSIERTIKKLESIIEFPKNTGWINHKYLEVLDANKDFPIKNWIPKYKRLCLKCIEEQRPLSIEFDLPFTNYCSRHKVNLQHCCPNCKAEFIWDYRLQVHCYNCGVNWEFIDHKPFQPSFWQSYWRITGNKIKFRRDFSTSILKAARPKKLDVENCANFDINPSIHDDMLSFSWKLFTKPRYLSAYHYGLIKGLPGASRYKPFDIKIVNQATSFIEKNRLEVIEDLLPLGFKFNHNKKSIDGSVSALEAIKLLDLDKDLGLDRLDFPSREQFLFRLRSAIPVLNELGLSPIEYEKRATRLQYRISDLHEVNL